MLSNKGKGDLFMGLFGRSKKRKSIAGRDRKIK